MKSVLNIFKLSRPAMLYDSHLYILKGFVSILTAYVLFHDHEIVGRDMISLFFGMMMTLEAVNITGIKSGINQIKATVLGGAVTAIFVGIFGINWLTIPLAVAMTMYISLKYNWRMVSPVAIFTAIYMTQYIQMDASGMPSMLLTLRLRLLALGTGVGIAIFYNYLFSLFFYNSMLKKRLVYIIECLETHLETYIKEQEAGDLQPLKTEITGLFSDIDSVIGQLYAIKPDQSDVNRVEQYGMALKALRDLTHYFLDVIMYRMKYEKESADLIRLQEIKHLIGDVKNTVATKFVDLKPLRATYERYQALDLTDERYITEMYRAAMQTAACFIVD